MDDYLVFFENIPQVRAVASMKTKGNMKGDDGLDGLKNRSNFFLDTLPTGAKFVLAGIDHGSQVAEVGEFESGKTIGKTDALVTSAPGIFLGVTFADCPFVLFSGPSFGKKGKRFTVGIAHCGYRGVAKNIVVKTIQKMQKKGVKPGYIKAIIGPGICKNCFEFGPEAEEIFREFPEHIQKNISGKFHVDLKGIIRQQLISQGLLENNIQVSEECTFEDEKFFSARREKMKTDNIRAGIAAIGIRELQRKIVYPKKFSKLRAMGVV